ncbi:MAG: FmdB family zinc ribbon protein [Candidatus Binatia bacterium]
MPIYEYQCRKCGLFEATQKIIDKPLTRCPKCKGKVKRLISNTSFQLKGSGWYITDYARKEKASETGKTSGSEAKGDGKADSGSKTEPKSSEEKKPAKAASESAT